MDSVLRVFADAEAVSQAAAVEFVQVARAAIAARGHFYVALSGGSTPQRLYQLLAEPPYRDQIAWNAVEVFWGDERAVPADHKDSNYHMARQALLDHVPLPPNQIHRIEAERGDRDQAARDYQTAMASAFDIDAAGPPPSFDLVLLGMGGDGHTASLFPNTSALQETERWIAPNFVPKFAADRLTLTYPVINAARDVLFLVAGADKADVLREVIQGPSDPDRLPSQRIRPMDGKLTWYLDGQAAARLDLPGGGGQS